MAILSNRKSFIATAAAGAGLVVIATVALAGCGQVSVGRTISGASGSGTHAGQSDPGQSPGQPGAPMALHSVCADPAAVTSVRVTRLPSLSQMGQTKPVPKKLPGITVGDRARVRALARLICDLPKMPHGVLSCPIDIGGGYRLIFAAGGRRLPAVTVRASGCESVSGAAPGGMRWVERTPKFWTRLARLTGIQAPAHSP